MKNAFLIIVFLMLPLIGLAQASTDKVNAEVKTITVSKGTTLVKHKQLRNTKHIKINRRKSNDIISIKAFKKSLKANRRAKTFVC